MLRAPATSAGIPRSHCPAHCSPGSTISSSLRATARWARSCRDADATNTGLNISGASGKVALVNSASGLACNGGSAPCSPAQLAQIVDLVGYGAANFYENAAAPLLTNQTAALRLSAGCVDTDVNNADFTTGAPSPKNTASPSNPCGSSDNAPVVSTCPANLAVTVGIGAIANLSANDADGVVTSAVDHQCGGVGHFAHECGAGQSAHRATAGVCFDGYGQLPGRRSASAMPTRLRRRRPARSR